MQVDHYVIASWNPAGGTVTEALVVAIDLFDPDGAGELSLLDVRLNDSDLSWTLSVDELSYHEQDGQRWYTTAPLVIEGQSRMPRGGEVQITARDLSGREDRRDVPLPGTLPELTVQAAARVNEAGGIVPGDEMESLVVVLESSTNGRREVREVADPVGVLPLSRVFEHAVIHRLKEASEPYRIWLLHEWSPRLLIESGPWELDPAVLPFPDEP